MEARRRAGLSQAELSDKSGIKQPAISRIESGRVVPNVETLDRLLRECGESLESVSRLGEGIDRTMIRRQLKLTPAERLRKASEEGGNLERLKLSARRI